MFDGIVWRDIVLVLSTTGIISSLFLAWVKWQLSGDFARKPDIDDLSRRLKEVEGQMVTMPTQDDMRRIGDRLGGVERDVGITAEAIRGMRESQGRIEQSLSMLIQHHLKEGT